MTTRYVDPTNDDVRRWQAKGACLFCGSEGNDWHGCFCRRCDSCSAIWIADTRRAMPDSDFGPLPAREDCFDCVEAEEAAREQAEEERLKFESQFVNKADAEGYFRREKYGLN